MIVTFYIVAAVIIVWSQRIWEVPEWLLAISIAIAWFANFAAALGDLGLLFGIAGVSSEEDATKLEQELREEKLAGPLWWWTALFAATLLVSGFNALSLTALALAVFKSLLSLRFTRRCEQRLAELRQQAQP